MLIFLNVFLLLCAADTGALSGSGDAYDSQTEVEEDDVTLCVEPVMTGTGLDEYLYTNYTDSLRDALCIITCMEEVRALGILISNISYTG